MCKQERRAQGWEVSWKGSLVWPLLRDETLDREGLQALCGMLVPGSSL